MTKILGKKIGSPKSSSCYPDSLYRVAPFGLVHNPVGGQLRLKVWLPLSRHGLQEPSPKGETFFSHLNHLGKGKL
jgi:hypothetical protein